MCSRGPAPHETTAQRRPGHYGEQLSHDSAPNETVELEAEAERERDREALHGEGQEEDQERHDGHRIARAEVVEERVENHREGSRRREPEKRRRVVRAAGGPASQWFV